jgi:hypothetical protein
MELRGEFKSITEVLDLLQIISLGKKSGEVNLRSSEGSLTIHFQDGRIINFDSSIPVLRKLRERVIEGNISTEEAANFLLHYISFWDDGRFVFIEKPVSVKAIGNADTLNVMMEFSKETDETPPNVQKLLKENAYMTLTSSIEEEITIDPLEWKILVEFTKGKTIREVIFTLCPSYGEGVKKIERLLKLKTIQVSEKPQGQMVEFHKETKEAESPAIIPSEKLEQIREILTATMGPMGEFLIDETLEELDISQLTYDLVPNFIDILLNKIPESCLVEGESCRDRLREEFERILIGGGDEA